MAVERVVVDAPTALNLLGGVVLLALGAWVLSVKPRRATNLALAGFTLALGARFALGNLVNATTAIVVLTPDDPWLLLIGIVRLGGMLAAAGAACAVAMLVPTRASRRELALPAALLAAQVVVGGLMWIAASGALPNSPASGALNVAPFADLPPLVRGLWLAEAFARSAILSSALTASIVTLALRYRRAAASERHSIALVAAAFSVIVGTEIGSYASPRSYILVVAQLAACAIAVALWLHNADRLEGHRREARVLAWILPGALLLGRLGSASTFPNSAGVPGIARTLGAAILTYAILRAQLLGMDVRVRWGIQRSTLAAIFVVVFFVASEIAQQWFGATNAYVGILAAGALLFALAPLQRFAEKVANAAVPEAAAKPMAATDRAWAYAEAARAAWADGALSRDERAMLDRLREALVIPEDEAHRIEREASKGEP